MTAIENFDFYFAFGPREHVLTRVARECVVVLAPVRFPSPGGEITSTRIAPGSLSFILDFSGFRLCDRVRRGVSSRSLYSCKVTDNCPLVRVTVFVLALALVASFRHCSTALVRKNG